MSGRVSNLAGGVISESKPPLWFRMIPARALALLAPGEQVRFYGTVGNLAGDDRIGKDPNGRIVTGVNWNPVDLALGTGGLQYDDGVADRMVGGTAATGAAGSFAAQWIHAVNNGKDYPRLMVTSTRLFLLLTEMNSYKGPDGKLVFDDKVDVLVVTPRHAVASVQARPRPLMFGRVRITFADASTVSVITGMISWRKANMLRRALR